MIRKLLLVALLALGATQLADANPTTPLSVYGNTVALTTSGSGSTSTSRQITLANIGVTVFPSQVMVSNPTGNAIVWISFTSATATIAIPAAGTTTAGTPTYAIPILPGAVVVFTITAGPNLWVQDISTSTSQTYYLTFGEGT